MGLLGGATPLYVLGPARSGTTFLAAMLNAHPAILQTNEVGLIYKLFPNARYIFLMRDPRDAICSLAEMNQTLNELT